MNQPIRLLKPHELQQEPPMEDQVPTPTQNLALFGRIQDMAYHFGQQVQQLQTNGQLILQDLLRQARALQIDDANIEDERARAHAEVDFTFDKRRQVNAQQQEAVRYQIDYYTGDAPETVLPGQLKMVPAIAAPKRRTWREKLLRFA